MLVNPKLRFSDLGFAEPRSFGLALYRTPFGGRSGEVVKLPLFPQLLLAATAIKGLFKLCKGFC